MKSKQTHRAVTMFAVWAVLGCDTKLGNLPDDADSNTDTGATGMDSQQTGDELLPAVDVLFVVDNSGSMGEEQANLVANMSVLRDVFDQYGLDYRIGFTTTDNGNPLCPNTSPLEGRLRAVSCLDRLEEFQFGSGVNTVDATAACTSSCTLPGLTTTDGNPWIQRGPNGTNLPSDVTFEQAFACFGLQGINGCGMESPLESMLRVIDRSSGPSEKEYGFFREGAVAAIAFVTDEVDCSARVGEIFPAEGNRVFWSDPDAAQATSAVCWKAGVECSGGPTVYGECHATNKDVAGQSGATDEDAVLYPVKRYIDALEALRSTRSGDVVVAGLVGVPLGYQDGSADLVYSAEQTDHVLDFGIDPGCIGSSASASPPVRLREVVEAFTGPEERNLYSVCADNYTPALEALATTIVARF